MRKVAWSAFTSVFVLAVANAYALDSLYSRNLSCSRFSAARERQICEALQREMEWTWTGHAIIAPSFRVTFGTARRVYCALSLSGEDTATLINMIVALERKPDGAMASAQALNGTRFLLFVLGESALLKFPTREKQWDDSTWRIVKNLEQVDAERARSADDLAPEPSSIHSARRLPLDTPRERVRQLRLTIFRALDRYFCINFFIN